MKGCSRGRQPKIRCCLRRSASRSASNCTAHCRQKIPNCCASPPPARVSNSRVPSFYAFAAHRAAGGPEIEVREFEERARSATRTRIGWPAPPDPGDAIDDAEFDLATLAPLVKGSGEYLKSLPGRAAASLRARWMRWDKPWKAADGLFIEEIGSDALQPYRLTERPWSPSLLQQYARCPYRFALRGIFGLRPADRPAAIQRMDPAERGNLYHAVQFGLLRDLGAAGIAPVNGANLAAARCTCSR